VGAVEGDAERVHGGAGDVIGIEVLRSDMRCLVEHPVCLHVMSISDQRLSLNPPSGNSSVTVA
jgi:hypothetical protein